MPLVWAHAEHIKLLRSLADGAVFDLPPQPVRRYQRDRKPPRVRALAPRLATPSKSRPAGFLRIDLPEPSVVTWSQDDWHTQTETPTQDTGLSVHAAELTPAHGSASLAFTWRGTAEGAANGDKFVVTID